MSSPLERALAVRRADVVVGEFVAEGPAVRVLVIADDARGRHRQTRGSRPSLWTTGRFPTLWTTVVRTDVRDGGDTPIRRAVR
jgi:hypothetical protein